MLKKIYDYFVLKVLGRIMWPGFRYLLQGKEYDLSHEQTKTIVSMMNERRYIGLNYRKTHLTSYFIGLSHFLLTGRWGKWAHAFVNVEASTERDCDLKIIEAVGSGVRIARFWDVLNCDKVVLLDANLDDSEWNKVSDLIRGVVGRKYDTRFKINDSMEFSCVELPYWAIKSVKPEAVKNLTKMIEKSGNLTPDMYLESEDFEVIYLT